MQSYDKFNASYYYDDYMTIKIKVGEVANVGFGFSFLVLTTISYTDLQTYCVYL